MRPPSRPDLLETLDQLGTTAWSGTTYRFTSPKRDPLSGEGARLFGGRWNPRDSFPCIYLAEPREACLAEFHRRAEGQARGAASLLPQVLHTIEVVELRALDLSVGSALEQVGLSPTDIAADDHTACAEVGAAAHFLGYQGIRAPSATGTGFVVAAFQRHLEAGQLVPAGSEELDLD